MLQNSLRRNRDRKQSWLKPWAEVDWLLLLLPIGLTAFGGIVIRSILLHGEFTHYWWQHLVLGGLGTIAALGLARYQYKNLMQSYWIVYAIANVSLLIVIFLGTSANGAQSWINIFGFHVQPSEFAKVALVITLAGFLEERTADRLPVLVQTLAVVALPWGLVLLQPDLGTSLVFGAIVLGMLYWANANPGWLILLISPLVSAILFNTVQTAWIAWVAAMGIIAWMTLPWRWLSLAIAAGVNAICGKLGEVGWNLLAPYQQDRITLFLHPHKDPLGGGYHLIQSRIAIGSGQVLGRGLNQGTQTQGGFIPEQHTDFIFSAIGEEWGFVGCILAILAFWLICLRLVMIAQTAQDNFGSLLAIGVLSMLVFQSFVNISMTIGLAPITGIPLPWLSYGRSSLLASFIAIGLVESVANHRERSKF
jgi:rod shape determining protein RodA